MRKGLGKVPELPLGDRVVLFGEEAEIVAQRQQALEEVAASSSRPIMQSASASQKLQTRNVPSRPARPSSVSMRR